MLGDTMPWLFPLVALLLCAWLVIGFLEKGGQNDATFGKKVLSPIIHWTPPALFAGLFIHRFTSILTMDSTHMDVLQYLPEGAALSERLSLVVAGQGGIELAAFAATTFAVCSIHLPSVKAMSNEAGRIVQQRMMMFCALCLLLGIMVLFPEQAYTASQPLPQQGSIDAPPLSNALLPLLFSLLVMFGGELFAASSVYSIEVDFDALGKKASIKCLALIGLSLVWLTTQPLAWTAWMADLSEPTNAMALLMMIHAVVVLTSVLYPSRRIESRLLHGEGRSIALIATFATVATLMTVSASLLLNHSTLFSNGTGAALLGFWLCTGVLGSMLLVQFMPTLGFDAAPRPETWWLRMMGLLTPMLVMSLTPFGAFLIAGVWIGLAWSAVVPWMVERDVASPSAAFVTVPMVGLTVAALALPLFTGNSPLVSLFAALPVLAVAHVGMLIHKPSAPQQAL